MKCDKCGEFTISYPAGIGSDRMKILMSGLTDAMHNGFAHYSMIESVRVEFDRVFITRPTDIAEYVLADGKRLVYARSHSKEDA